MADYILFSQLHAYIEQDDGLNNDLVIGGLVHANTALQNMTIGLTPGN